MRALHVRQRNGASGVEPLAPPLSHPRTPGASIQVGCGLANDLLAGIEPGSVRLVCTSPRFWDRISYERAAAGDPHPWQRVGRTESLSDYIEEHLESAALLLDCCADDATLCLEIQDCRARADKEQPLVLLSDYWRQILQATGWRVTERITVERDVVPGRGNRSGHFVRHAGRPGYFLPDPVASDLIIAFKGDPLCRLRREWDGESRIDVAWAQQFLKNVWHVHIPPRPSRRGAHPCPMSRELAQACILFYSSAGDVVVDPWAGEGTVAAIAAEHGRLSIAIEKQPTWAADILRRLSHSTVLAPMARGKAQVPGSQLLLTPDVSILAATRRAFGNGAVTARHREMARAVSRQSGVAFSPEMVALFLRAERHYYAKAPRTSELHCGTFAVALHQISPRPCVPKAVPPLPAPS